MDIAVIGEKGGSGKTTLATNLAGFRSGRLMDGRVALIDADRQGSSTFWMEERGLQEGLPRIEAIRAYGDNYKRSMRGNRSYVDSVSDIPSGDGEEQKTALYTADCVIVPVRPGAFDVWTLGLLDLRIADVRRVRPDLAAWVVLNAVPAHRHNRDRAEARKAIEETCNALQLAKVEVCDRVSIRRAISDGLTVEEYTPTDNRGTAEMLGVYKLAFGEKGETNGYPA